LLVRALSEGDFVRAAAELAIGALLVFVAPFTVGTVGGGLAVRAAAEPGRGWGYSKSLLKCVFAKVLKINRKI